MAKIRSTFALLAFCSLAAIVPRPTVAETYRPWCAQYFDSNSGTTNCGFTSYEQCMATARGAGAWCVQNPWYLAYGEGGQKARNTTRSGRSSR
jgi:Protein of unknown function (DUF3551)